MDDFDVDELDSDKYDVEGIRTDMWNNNFTPDRLEEYTFENQMKASLVNGQFTQARNQCDSVGLNYELELCKFNRGEATMTTWPTAPDAVLLALEHVRSLYPFVVMVVYSSDGRWQYMNDGFDSPVFDDRVDVGILEDASDAVTELPAVFEIIDGRDQ